MNLIINKKNYIICSYNLTKKDIGKDIQIINHGYQEAGCSIFKKINEEIYQKIQLMVNDQ